MNFKQSRLGLALVAVSLILFLVMPVAPARAVLVDYVPGEVLVKLYHAADLEAVAASYALDVTPQAQFGSRAIYRLRILDGASPPAKAAALTGDGRVMYAEPNFISQAPEGRRQVSWAKGGDAGAFAGQWAAEQLRLAEAHTVSRGAGITVAVLDTGVDAAHPALAGRLLAGYDFVDLDDDPSEASAPELSVVYGHGTHVAGLVTLVAPESSILPVRVLDAYGAGNVWVIAEALAYAADPDGNPSTPDGADVINLSLSTTRPTQLLAEVVGLVVCSNDDDDDDEDDGCISGKKGAVVVAAAGNSASDLPEYPAAEAIDGVLSIGSSTATDAMADFSNFGAWVSALAPGVEILSSLPGGEYGAWSGTSMSAPLVAGQVALILNRYPQMTPAEVAELVLDTAVQVGGPVPLRVDPAAALGVPVGKMGGDYTCTGSLGRYEVDNLTVPSGQTCTLSGTIIRGNLKVESRGSLQAQGIRVQGSIQVKGASALNIRAASVSGNIQVEQAASIGLDSSQVTGDVQVFKNTGSISITGNSIGGNLQCKDNRFLPTGGENQVKGKKEAQCSRL